MKPLGDRVMVKQVDEKSKTALIIPQNLVRREEYAIVLGVGPDVKHIVEGDKIYFDRYSGTEFKDTGYLFLHENEVIAKE